MSLHDPPGERASTVTYEVHMCTEGNADFDHVINCPALHTRPKERPMQTPEEFVRFEIGSTVDDWLDEGEAVHLIRARDAEVAARALRDAAHEIFLGYWITAPVVRWLHERADVIEREGGESDADT